jgi:hypothetical protein
LAQGNLARVGILAGEDGSEPYVYRVHARRKTMTTKVLLIVLVVCFSGCSNATDPCEHRFEYPTMHPERVAVPEGVWGLVAFWDGDFMPLCPSGTIDPVGRELRIHTLTQLDQVEEDDLGGFYAEVRTSEVARVWSDADGFFQVGLPPGQYSLFSLEDTVLYANRFSAEGINPFTVLADTVVSVIFDITWNSTH